MRGARTFFLLLLSAAALLSFIPGFGEDAGGAKGRLVVSSGAAEGEIRPGATVKAAGGAAAVLLFDDGTLVIAAPEASLRYGGSTPQEAQTLYSFELLSGRAAFVPSPFGSAFRLKAGRLEASGERRFEAAVSGRKTGIFAPFGGILTCGRALAAGESCLAQGDGPPLFSHGRPPLLSRPVVPWRTPGRSPFDNSAPEPSVNLSFDPLTGRFTADASDTRDPDGDTVLRIWWEPLSGPFRPVRRRLGRKFSFAADRGEVVFACHADDGLLSGRKEIRFRVGDRSSNAPPRPAISGAPVVQAGKAVSFSAARSQDPDGDPLTFRWLFSGGPLRALSAHGETGSVVFARPGIYKVKLIASDIYGNSGSAAVNVRVVRRNLPPSAKADAYPKEAHVGVPVALDSSGSSDPEGAPLTASWSIAQGPPGATVESAGARAVFRAFSPGEYRLRLVVSDGEKLSAPSYVDVTVLGHRGPPVAAVSTPVFCSAGDTVVLDAERSWCETGRKRLFSWRFVSGPPCSLTDTTGARVPFTPRFPGSYRFEVTVSDGERSAAATVEVRVSPVNNPPTVKVKGPSRASVGGKVRFEAEGTDPDGDILTFRWKVEGPGGFDLSAGTRALEFVPPREGSYSVSVTAADGFASSRPAELVLTALKSLRKPLLKVAVSPSRPETHRKVIMSAVKSVPGQGGVLSFRWFQMGGPETELEGAESVVCSFLPEMEGEYVFLLTASEQGGLQAMKEVRVRVRRGNAPPVAVAPSRIFVAQGDSFTLKGSWSFDPEGKKIRGFWRLLPCPAPPWKERFDSLDVELEARRPGVFRFRLEVSDGRAQAAAECEVVCFERAFRPLDVRPNSALVEPQSELFVAVSGLDEGERFRCFQIRGQPVAFETTPEGVNLHFIFGGVYEFGVVSTGGRPRPPAFFMAAVRGSGDRLRVECSVSRAAGSGGRVYLTAKVRGDYRGKPTFEWRQTTGPILEPLESRGGVLVVAPVKAGIYEFEVSARVDGREAEPARVRFAVHNDRPPPVADAGSDINATIALPFTLDASLSKHPGGRDTTFAWRQISGPHPLIEGKLEGRRVELAAPETGLYVFELAVSDGYSVSTDRVNVTVRPPDRSPRAVVNWTRRCSPGCLLVLDCSASQDPDGDPLTFRLEQTAGPPLPVPAGARTTPFFVLRPDRPGAYGFRLEVADGLGGAAQAEVTVHVEPEKSPPPEERILFETRRPLSLAEFLSRASEALGVDFSVGDALLRKYHPPAGKPLTIPPVSWRTAKSTLPCCIGHELGAMSREEDGGTGRRRILFVRDYSFLREERAMVGLYPVPGVSTSGDIEGAIRFMEDFLEPALREGGGSLGAEKMQLVANLPESGHRRLRRYLSAAAPVRPFLPVDFEKSGFFESPGSAAVRLRDGVRTLWDVLAALKAALPGEVEICPFLAHEARNIPLDDESLGLLSGGVLPASTVASRLRERFPGLAWRRLSGGSLFFTLADRQLLERSCESVWDSGEVVVTVPPPLPPASPYLDIAEEIRSAEPILAELWSRRDAGVFCGYDPRGRLVLCNSPAALSYTLEYLWKRLEEEARGK